VQDGRTITAVIPQQGEDRRNELAQMLGPVGEGTLHSVDEILQIVREKIGQNMT
jgi:ribosome recycling factor